VRESLSEPVAVKDRRDSTRRMGLRDAVRAAHGGVGAAGKLPPLTWEAGIGQIVPYFDQVGLNKSQAGWYRGLTPRPYI